MRNTLTRNIIISGLAITILFSTHTSVGAYGRSSYYDWGPYYGNQKVLGLKAYAQEPLPSISLPKDVTIPQPSFAAPDSPFYVDKTAWEGTQTAFTFDPVKKEELKLNFANERLAEVKKFFDKGEIKNAKRFSQK